MEGTVARSTELTKTANLLADKLITLLWLGKVASILSILSKIFGKSFRKALTSV